MADQRCPMCGKVNPAEAEVCQFCQARLKPLIIPPSSGSPGPTNGKSAQPDNPASADSSLPDWLRDLKPEGSSDFGQESNAGLPDWMDAPSDESGDQELMGGLPDWLSGEKNQPETPASAGEDAGLGDESLSPAVPSLDFPDWLSSIRKGDQEETGQPPEDEVSSSEEPFEMASSEELPIEEDSSSQKFDQWLNQASSAEESEPEKSISDQLGQESSDDESIQEDSDIPDWLQRVRSHKQEEPGAVPEEGSEEAAPAEVPDWLSGIQEVDSSESGETTPDWLSGVTSGEAQQPDEPGDEVPDWLKTLPSDRGEEKPTGTEATQPDDWLQEIERSAAFAVDSDETTEEPPTPAAPVEEVPDWLAKLDTSPSEKPEGSVPALIFDSEEDLGPFNPEDEKPRFAVPDLNQEPDWISHVPADEASPQKPSGADGVPEEDLEKADLPGWLEAMRPVEAAAPNAPLDDETSATIETSGPLQGMRGALPAQPAFGRLRKPPVQSLKLSITDNQKSHIALLEGLLSNEDEPKALPRQSVISSQSLVRLLVAAVMIISVLAPMFLGQGIVDRPSSQEIPSEISNTSLIAGSIGTGEPVLVAFDYDAGLAGEVEAAASSMLTQLASHNVLITAVSTNISGPVLAQRWFEAYNLGKTTPYQNFYNLGYIPAGPAGLLAFAADPARVMPYDLQDTKPVGIWNSGPLASIKKISDYKLIVVLTDNTDSARAWIEQVEPLLRETTPLLVASSAQVEPMLRPYYASSPRQIDGFVSGLSGGVAYESLTGLPPKAGWSWDSMGAGILVAAILILAGGIINGTLTTISIIKKEAGEEE